MKKLKKSESKKQTFPETLKEVLKDATAVDNYDLTPKEEKKLEKDLRLINRELKLITKLKYTFTDLHHKSMTRAEAKEFIADVYESKSKLLCIRKFTDRPEVTKMVKNFRAMQSDFMKSVNFGVEIYRGNEVLKLGKKIP